ncbi:MAG TPA: ABC transporter permease [Thermoanaerobaculia bacterium]
MNLWFDLKYAWRLLYRTPGYSLLCVVVVALSIGLALCSYTLAYAMALKPLPFPGTERWFSIQVVAGATGTPRLTLDAYTYQEMLDRNRTANHLGAFTTRNAVLSEGQASVSLRSTHITPRLLSAMQTAPRMGRLFEAADSQPGAPPAVILSHQAWQNHFAGDPAVVGKQTRIDAQPVRVVGVMPEEFFAFEDSEIWLPLQLPRLARPSDSTVVVAPLIVLDEGQTPEALLPEMQAAMDDVNQRYPGRYNAARHLALIPARLIFSHGNLQIVATVVFIAAAVLLLGCVNISMIFLARLLERSRELALRTAVGASRARLLRQCLLETALIVLAGVLIGWGLAAMGVEWMHSIDRFGRGIQASGRSSNLPMLRMIDLIPAVIAATVIWLLSTLIPAWRVAKQDAALVLAGSGKGVAGPGSARSASILVGVQVIVSSLVLVLCANLVVSIRDEGNKPTGLKTERVIISTYPTVFGARYGDMAARLRYWDELTAAIQRRVAGTEVAYATTVPSRPVSAPVIIEDQEGAAKLGTQTLPFTAVSDGYFALLGVQRRAGRLFDSTDTAGSLPVAVIDEKTANRHWPGQNVVGKRIRINPAEEGPWLTIIGVVSAVSRSYDRDLGVVYRPLRQAEPEAFHLIARVPPSALDRRPALRAAAFAVDRDLPLHNLQTLVDFMRVMNLNSISMVPFFSVITLITLILAATGLFGLISRSVARRTQEVGVRRALGGTQWQVTAVFLRQGAWYLSIAVVGVALGIGLANAITSSIPNIMNRAVPVTLGVLVLMALVIFTASYLPTRRAVALEPGDALRYE